MRFRRTLGEILVVALGAALLTAAPPTALIESAAARDQIVENPAELPPLALEREALEPETDVWIDQVDPLTGEVLRPDLLGDLPVVAPPRLRPPGFEDADVRPPAAEGPGPDPWEGQVGFVEGESVELVDRGSEDTEVFANPDGTFSERIWGGPVRVLEDGVWEPIDLRLTPGRLGQVGPDRSAVPTVIETRRLLSNRAWRGGLGRAWSLGGWSLCRVRGSVLGR